MARPVVHDDVIWMGQDIERGEAMRLSVAYLLFPKATLNHDGGRTGILFVNSS
jgi:hypothetical protein